MIGTILIILLIIFLLSGFSGRFGGYGYGYGNGDQLRRLRENLGWRVLSKGPPPR